MATKKKLIFDREEVVEPKDTTDHFNLSSLKNNLSI